MKIHKLTWHSPNTLSTPELVQVSIDLEQVVLQTYVDTRSV